jgi:hypothetical protein
LRFQQGTAGSLDLFFWAWVKFQQVVWMPPGDAFRKLPRRLQGLPRFVITRGGEYCFMPGLRALRWLADLWT